MYLILICIPPNYFYCNSHGSGKSWSGVRKSGLRIGPCSSAEQLINRMAKCKAGMEEPTSSPLPSPWSCGGIHTQGISQAPGSGQSCVLPLLAAPCEPWSQGSLGSSSVHLHLWQGKKLCAHNWGFFSSYSPFSPLVSHCSPLPSDPDTSIMQGFSQPLLTCSPYSVTPSQGQGDFVEDTALLL